MCNLAALIASLALLLRRRWLYAVLYFWGIALSSQGLLTPDIQRGPAAPSFWLFWLRHGEIVGFAAYAMAVHDFRPTWRDYRVAVVTGLAYLTVVFPVDVLFGFNYGFVGNGRPERPSLVDFLGPWPARVIVKVALAGAAMAALLVPWQVGRRLRGAAA